MRSQMRTKVQTCSTQKDSDNLGVFCNRAHGHVPRNRCPATSRHERVAPLQTRLGRRNDVSGSRGATQPPQFLGDLDFKASFSRLVVDPREDLHREIALASGVCSALIMVVSVPRTMT